MPQYMKCSVPLSTFSTEEHYCFYLKESHRQVSPPNKNSLFSDTWPANCFKIKMGKSYKDLPMSKGYGKDMGGNWLAIYESS